MGLRHPKKAVPRSQREWLGEIHCQMFEHFQIGCTRLRGRTATQRSEKGSEKVLAKGFAEGF